MMLTLFSVLSLILGSVYLYYYSEVKSTKKSRKGAILFFGLVPVFSIINILIAMVVLFMTGHANHGFFVWNIITPKSGTLPASGFWISLFCMIINMVSLCFSKFWKSRRAEKVREDRKRIERDDEFMRSVGLDPDDSEVSTAVDTSEGSSSSSDEEVG